MPSPYAKYTGQQIQPVPAGYLTAFGQAGKSIGAGMKDFGEGIGEAIKAYHKNKDDRAAADTTREIVASQLESVVQKKFKAFGDRWTSLEEEIGLARAVGDSALILRLEDQFKKMRAEEEAFGTNVASGNLSTLIKSVSDSPGANTKQVIAAVGQAQIQLNQWKAEDEKAEARSWKERQFKQKQQELDRTAEAQKQITESRALSIDAQKQAAAQQKITSNIPGMVANALLGSKQNERERIQGIEQARQQFLDTAGGLPENELAMAKLLTKGTDPTKLKKTLEDIKRRLDFGDTTVTQPEANLLRLYRTQNPEIKPPKLGVAAAQKFARTVTKSGGRPTLPGEKAPELPHGLDKFFTGLAKTSGAIAPAPPPKPGDVSATVLESFRHNPALQGVGVTPEQVQQIDAETKRQMGVKPKFEATPIEGVSGAIGLTFDGKFVGTATLPKVKPGMTRIDSIRIPGTNKVQPIIKYADGTVQANGAPQEMSSGEIDREYKVEVLGPNAYAFSKEGAKDLRKQVADIGYANIKISRLLEIANTAGEEYDPEKWGEVDGIITFLKGRLRLSLVGPGAVSEAEWTMMEKAIPDPTKIFQWESQEKKGLETLRDNLNQILKLEAEAMVEGKLKKVVFPPWHPDHRVAGEPGQSTPPGVTRFRATPATGNNLIPITPR